MSSVSGTALYAEVRRELSGLLINIEEIYQNFGHTFSNSTDVRAVPVAFMLAGPPEIAKSSISEQIYTELFARTCSAEELKDFYKRPGAFIY